jgi:hypothetical protein
MMTYIQSDPNLQKYQWIGEIEKDGFMEAILPFLYYSKSLGEIEKDKQGNYTVECSFEIPFRTIHYREENNRYIYDLELSIEVKNDYLKSTLRDKKDIRKGLSLESLQENIREGYSLHEKIIIPLEKGTNKVYFSLHDNIQQKSLRKLDIIKIK